MQLEIGKRYRILKIDQSVIEGEHYQTRGNDEEFPSFKLDDGTTIGVARRHVLGEVNDDCPVDGIPRLVAIDGADESVDIPAKEIK